MLSANYLTFNGNFAFTSHNQRYGKCKYMTNSLESLDFSS